MGSQWSRAGIVDHDGLWQIGAVVRSIGEMAEGVRLPGEKMLELGMTLPAHLEGVDIRRRNWAWPSSRECIWRW